MGFSGQVRPASAADAAEVARIYIASWNEGFGHLLGRQAPSPRDVGQWAGELTSGPARWWVAETQGRLAGFAGICPSRDPVQAGLGELDTIAVDPADWRTGVGRALMTGALDALRGDGYVGPPGTDPFSIAATAGAIYVANQGANTVTVFNPGNLKVTATVNVGNSPYGVAAT